LNQEVSWHELSPSDYAFDPVSRTVSINSLKPGEALRIEQLNLVDKQYEAWDFPVEEIAISGAAGEIRIQGDQVYKSFVAESKKTYTITYR